MPEPLLGYGLSRRVALEHHLRHNHFPPVVGWTDEAEAAIEAALRAVEDCDYDGTILAIDNEALSEPIVHHASGRGFSVSDIMDNLHLWSFVQYALATQAANDDDDAIEDDDENDVDYEPKAGE